ncbi:MAG: hypothetical protein ACR2P3_00785 [Geminicoccaceae bacterium]
MTYEAANQDYLNGFAAGWAAFDPTWDQKKRIEWPYSKKFNAPAAPWLKVIFGDVDGFNDAVGVLDTQVALFTVDIYVPIATESPTLLRRLADEVRGVIRKISTPTNARPGNLSWRSFGKTTRGEAHGRVGLELEYTLSDVT